VPHLSDGTLRRMVDEPLALTADEQLHFDGCAQCHSRFDAIATGARASDALLAVPAFEPQPAAALAALRPQLAQQLARPAPFYQRWIDRNGSRVRPLATPLVAAGLALILLTGITVTGVSVELLHIFQPTQVVPVQVSPSGVPPQSLLLDYGTVKWLPAPPSVQQLSDPSAAHTQTGLPVLMPATLPNGVSGPVTYGVVSQATGSLTFDADRLRASAASQHVKVNPMPSSIIGSTLVVNAGPALLEVWGMSGATEVQAPTLVIAQTRVPTVDSTGASQAQLENYLLSQPGVPPDLVSQVKAIKDPSTTLPLPIPKGLATTEPTTVNGHPATLIKAVIGAGVVWIQNGVIYAVGGQLTPDQVLAIATSLH
jgi:hypothetical protein